MSNIIAIGDIKTLLRQLKALEEVVSVVERIGELDAAHESAAKQTDAARDALSKVQAELSTANGDLAYAREAAHTAIEMAKRRADDIVRTAHDQADNIVREAEATAKARTDIVNDAVAAYQAGSDERAKANEQADAQLKAKQDELARIQNEISKLRERIS